MPSVSQYSPLKRSGVNVEFKPGLELLGMPALLSDPAIIDDGFFWYNSNTGRLNLGFTGGASEELAFISDIPAVPTTFSDSTFRVYNNADNTKLFALDCQYIDAATTRTFTVPNGNGIFSTTLGTSNLSTGANTYAYTTGFSDTVYGISAGTSLTSGDRCTAVGSGALTTNSTGDDNTALGNNTLPTTTGNGHTAVGSNAGFSMTTGATCTFLGFGANCTVGNEVSSIAIGYSAAFDASNQCVIGGPSGPITSLFIGNGANNDGGTPTATVTVQGTNAYNIADTAGTSLIVASGKGTGNATATTIKFQTPTAGGSGTTQQTLSDRLLINGTGVLAYTKMSVGAQDTMTINGSLIASQFAADSDTLSVYESHTHSATAGNGSVFYAARSRGTSASPTVVSNGDSLGRFGAVGYDGTDYAIGGILEFTVDGTPGSNDMPTKFEIKLSPDGSQTPATALTCDSKKSSIFSGRIQGAKGADVAAANDLTLGTDGNTFVITGNTQINAITTANWQAGSSITLIFSGTPTVKNNTAGGAGTAVLLLSGSADLVAAANTVLGLVYDGTQWQETFRKVA